MYGGTTSYGGTSIAGAGFPEQPPGEQKFATFTSQTGSPELMSPMWPGEQRQEVAEMDSSQRGGGGEGERGYWGDHGVGVGR